jgi:molybdate transport system permease protein
MDSTRIKALVIRFKGVIFMDLTPLFISLKTALAATVITFFGGIYGALLVMKMKRFKGLIDCIFTAPMILPPTVVGFFLLLIFGKNSYIGNLLYKFDITIVFSWASTVISAAVVSFPLMYRTTRGAFEQIDVNLLHAARTLGMPEWKISLKVILPISWPGLLAGVILAFTRAMGEFGATIMIAGNIPGRTQTIATAIYSAVQAGDRAAAYKWVAVISVISFMVIILMNYWLSHQKSIITKFYT